MGRVSDPTRPFLLESEIEINCASIVTHQLYPWTCHASGSQRRPARNDPCLGGLALQLLPEIIIRFTHIEHEIDNLTINEAIMRAVYAPCLLLRLCAYEAIQVTHPRESEEKDLGVAG